MKNKELRTTCVVLHNTVSDAIDKRADSTGETRSRIIEQALILSNLLELPPGTRAGMGRGRPGRPRKS